MYDNKNNDSKNNKDKNSVYKWQVLIVVMIGTMMAALDSSIVNVSIPAIMANFAVGISDIEWVVTGYMLAFAILMPLTSWFRDIFGYKRLYLLGLLTFTIGSILCGLAWNLPTLIISRVIQALGGGALTPTAMSMITEVFEPHERGKALGFWGTGILIGPAVGPTLGGLITKYFGWRLIFLVNVPVGIIGLMVAWYLLREDRFEHQLQTFAAKSSKFDLWGFLFLSIFLVSFLLGIAKGEQEGWNSRYIISCGLISLFSFLFFIIAELSIKESERIIDLGLFLRPIYTISMLVVMVRSLALFGGVFLLPLLLQQQMGFDEVQTGLILLPGALIVGLFLPIAGKTSDKIGPMIPSIFGLFGVVLFMYLYKDIDKSSSVWEIIKPTLIRGIGMAFLMAPVTATAMNAVPKNKAGMASSMLSIMQQIGGSLGIALLATVLDNRMKFHFNHFASNMNFNSPVLQETMTKLANHIHSHGYNYGQTALITKISLLKHLQSTAAIFAFRDVFLFGALVVAVVLIPVLFLPRKKYH